MLDINERLNSLAGYDMREVTTAGSDETMLNGARQLQGSGGNRRTRMASCGGQIHRQAVECRGCSR
jgi:hypothetical protein